MNDFDWLEGETDEETESVMTGEIQPAPKRKKRPTDLIRAERKLTFVQRFYMDCLMQCSTLAEAQRKMTEAGYNVDRSTLWRWRQNPNFGYALDLARKHLCDVMGVSKESVLLDAEKIKQMALTPRPRLYKGKHTGYEEVELGTALRALELQGKGVGIQDGEANRVQVNIDIDFSGRQDGIDEGVTVDG